MVTLDAETFSDGQNLTQWLIAGGAPQLPAGYKYTLHLGSQGGATKITAYITDSRGPVSEYTTYSRVSVAMAAVSAATYAFEAANL